jgi:hypothetical protein
MPGKQSVAVAQAEPVFSAGLCVSGGVVPPPPSSSSEPQPQQAATIGHATPTTATLRLSQE